MKSIRVEILAIGDELLYGQTLDTNSHWISNELGNAGFRVIRRTTIGDQEETILKAFAEAEQRADIILITGGLGPTSDDLTKPCLAKYFNCQMKLHPEALEEVTAFFTQRGRELTEINRQQAVLPVCCEKITNALGTAPGMWFPHNGKVFVSMPGVPFEMKRMMTDHILPRLIYTFSPATLVHQWVRTVGIGESFLAEKIRPWEESLPADIKLAYLPSEGGVKLRLTAIGPDKEAVKKRLEKTTAELFPLAGDYIYATHDEPLESVIGNLLRHHKLTLAVAESCTGGYVSHLITSIPGSSEYFQGAIIPYSYEIKMNNLGVNPETLREHGAVSEETIREMANLVREKFNTSIGVATSGIAGPGGATPEKPVGTVWIGFADGKNTVARKLQLSKDRLVNIRLTATAVLNLIRLHLPKEPQ